MQIIDNKRYFSAKDIAMAIAHPGLPDGVARAMRQVRHWTQHDLLRTISDKNTGRGRSRLYDEESTIFVASILSELTRFGITVEKMRPLADLLYEDFYADSDGIYAGAITGEWQSYIFIDWNVDPLTGAFGEPRVKPFSNAPKMNFRVKLADVLPKSSSATIINVNQVYERLNWGFINATQGR